MNTPLEGLPIIGTPLEDLTIMDTALEGLTIMDTALEGLSRGLASLSMASLECLHMGRSSSQHSSRVLCVHA